jgi:hypothetical protein
MGRGERLIDLDETPRRGEQVLGPIDTEDGPKLMVIHWRSQKRISNQQTKQLRREVFPRRSTAAYFGRKT